MKIKGALSFHIQAGDDLNWTDCDILEKATGISTHFKALPRSPGNS